MDDCDYDGDDGCESETGYGSFGGAPGDEFMPVAEYVACME